MRIFHTALVLFITTLSFGGTSFFIPKKITLTDIKKELKALPLSKEQEAAKTIVVNKEGIKYKDNFIPATDKSELKVLTVRLTVYWSRGGSTDYDSSRRRSSTGYTLKEGDSIAVDPRVIPYNSEVIIPNVGIVRAVDTGTDVIDRKASNGKMPVIDVYFTNKRDALEFANTKPKIVKVAVLN
jgi:3D (Asp-Asp-Asp) domain-containing protein